MNELQLFLLENPVDVVEEEVVVSQRFKNASDELLKFKIKAIDSETYADYQKACTIIKKKKAEFNTKKFQEMVVLECTLNPNFKDADMIKKAGCKSPVELLRRSLLAGEVANLFNKIAKLSGFSEDMDDLVEEVKND